MRVFIVPVLLVAVLVIDTSAVPIASVPNNEHSGSLGRYLSIHFAYWSSTKTRRLEQVRIRLCKTDDRSRQAGRSKGNFPIGSKLKRKLKLGMEATTEVLLQT